MAVTLHAGIIPGAQAKKLYTYPELSGLTTTYLSGQGKWVSSANVTVGTAQQAVKLQTPVDIAGYAFDGLQPMGRYARCTTKANEAIKKVTDMPNFSATGGAWLVLWLANANTAVSPMLQIGDGEPVSISENRGGIQCSFDDEVSCRRLVQGVYLLIHTNSGGWLIVSGPSGYYQTATSSESGMMSKTDKAAHDTMVSALTNQCTTEIDASGCMVVKLFGSNTPFIKIDKAGEW